MPSSAGTEVGTTMEISVSKSDLLKELTATQGVVERKTTIPILSNFLIEAEGDRLNITATDLDQAIRTSAEVKVKNAWRRDPNVLPRTTRSPHPSDLIE